MILTQSITKRTSLFVRQTGCLQQGALNIRYLIGYRFWKLPQLSANTLLGDADAAESKRT